MKNIYLYLAVILIFTACEKEKIEKKKLNGEALLYKKCSQCHNLDMPPKSYENEVAPSIMAVTFHLKDFIKTHNPSEHQSKVVAFIQDYVINPSASKSFCDKDSLDSYGVMPSQKGKVTEDELKAIAEYMYQNYDNQKLLQMMQEKNRLSQMPIQERVFEQQRCINCHDIDKNKVAPSFKNIANRYNLEDKNNLIKSIKEGSKGKWNEFQLIMPPFKKMNNEDINGIVDWILQLKKPLNKG